MSSYNVPDLAPGEIHREEEVIRRSRFIVSIARVQGPEQAKAFIDRIRTQRITVGHFRRGRPAVPRLPAAVTTENLKVRQAAPCSQFCFIAAWEKSLPW